MAVERKTIELELLPDQYLQFGTMMNVFEMEEPEELIAKMLLVMEAALNVSSKDCPDVIVCSADRQKEMGVRLG